MKKTAIKKAVCKRTADALEKLAVAGVALVVFQGSSEVAVLAGAFVPLSYIFTIWEAKL